MKFYFEKKTLIVVDESFYSGERPRDWSLGHAGDEGPHLSMTGESGLFSSGGPSVRFLTRYDGEVSEPLVRRAPGKSGLHASGEGERVIDPEPW